MASLNYLRAELSRVEHDIQNTQDLLDVEEDDERRYRYQVRLENLQREKEDLEASIQREEDAEQSNFDY